MPLDEALRCSLISFDSTLRSNVSVGMPLDAMIYLKDSLEVPKGKRINEVILIFNTSANNGLKL
jgi:putative proteasome-type protease